MGFNLGFKGLNSSQKQPGRKNAEGFVLIRTRVRKQQREIKLILILMTKQTLLCISYHL